MAILLTIKKGKWDSMATEIVGHFKDTGHPVFKGISALSRGILNFNGDSMNTELVFQTIHSVNRLSVYGAVAKGCHQFCLTEEEKVRTSFPVDSKIS